MRRIAHIADLHCGAANPRMLDALSAALHRLEPDVVVISGDLTQRGRVGEFRDARAFVESLPGVIVAVAGNHDVPRESVARFVRPLDRFARSMEAVAVGGFTDTEVSITGLNSARAWGLHWNWAHGRVSRRGLERARSRLGARSPGAFGVLVVHHPPVLFEPRRGFRPLGGGARLLAMLSELRAGAVMSGHLHATGWRIIDGVMHLHAGTCASCRVRGEANAFLLLEIGRDHVEVGEWVGGAHGDFARGRTERIPRRELDGVSG